MYYLIMLFMLGPGDDAPIDGYRFYEQSAFETLDECVAFYNQDKESYDQAAGIFSQGRHWKIICADQYVKDELDDLAKQPPTGVAI